MTGIFPLEATAAVPRRKPRLGFLGVGWIGRHRMEAVARSGAAEVAAIADPCIEAADAALGAVAKAERAASFDDLLAMGLDGIVIATPSACHAEQAIRALESGAAVFCQKPLARTASEARRVVDAARRADRLLAVDFSYRLTEGMRRIREVLEAGDIGDVFAVDLVFHNAYGPDKPWFYDPALAGGGCVMDLGSHLVDLALWSLDFPAVTSCASRLYAGGEEVRDTAKVVEDYAVATFDVETGATVRLACSWRLHAGCDAIIGASFYGTRGGLSFRNVNGSFYDFIAEKYAGTARETLAIPPDEWGGRAAVAWARRLAVAPTFSPEADRLVEVAHLLDAIYHR